MDEILSTIQECEAQIEQVREELQRHGRISEALAAYQGIERRLEQLDIQPLGSPHRERGRVLALCLGRKAEGLRHLGRFHEAGQTSARELAAARLSGDLITLAGALLSDGHTRLLNGDLGGGEHAIQEARRLFESGDSSEHKRGLGKYWTLRAELIIAGALPGNANEALEASDRAVNINPQKEDRSWAVRAYTARARAYSALGDNQAAALDLKRARKCKAKL